MNNFNKELKEFEEIENMNITGIYDPLDNDLSIGMWKNSNGIKILEIIEKIQNINLSKDADDILNVALMTNSYYPKKNITKDQFLKIKSDWLIKKQNFPAWTYCSGGEDGLWQNPN